MTDMNRMRMKRMKKNTLTIRQKATLNSIKSLIRRHKIPPTLSEIAEDLGITSVSVHEIVVRLEGKGMIKRKRKSHRSIEIIADQGV